MATTLTFTTRVSIRVHRDRPLNTRIDKTHHDICKCSSNSKVALCAKKASFCLDFLAYLE